MQFKLLSQFLNTEAYEAVIYLKNMKGRRNDENKGFYGVSYNIIDLDNFEFILLRFFKINVYIYKCRL